MDGSPVVGLFGDAVMEVNSNKSTAMLIIVMNVKDANWYRVGVSETAPFLSFHILCLVLWLWGGST